jgi:hypothetical protein
MTVMRQPEKNFRSETFLRYLTMILKRIEIFPISYYEAAFSNKAICRLTQISLS